MNHSPFLHVDMTDTDDGASKAVYAVVTSHMASASKLKIYNDEYYVPSTH